VFCYDAVTAIIHVMVLIFTVIINMSWTWFKNFAGATLTEDELRDIPRPHLELTIHVTDKCMQAFGLLGTCVVGPVAALVGPSTRNLTGIRRKATKCGLWGVAIGVVAGPLMTYGRLKSANADIHSVYDRCYRLRCNRGQVRVDQASTVGAVSGAMLSILLKTCPLFGALFGMSAGVLSMAAYNNTGSK